jgi:ABC-2 type transport system permease protein
VSVETADRVAPVVHEYTATEIQQVAARMPGRVLGPRALSGTPKRFFVLTWMLAYLDFKLKFFGSILGYVWQLVKPLAMFGVLYLVFTRIFRFGEIPNYGIVLLSGIVLMSFFNESTLTSIGSVLGAEGLIRKISFPIMSIPLASVTSLFLTLLLNYGVVLLFALATGVRPSLGWIEIVPLLFLLYLVAASVSLALSSFYVRFRDVQPIWEVFAQALFYATPVIYPIEYVQEHAGGTAATLMMCNPIATIIKQMRHAAIDPSSPSAVDVLGSWWMLLIPMGIVVLLTVFGYFSMKRLAPTVAEEM